MKRAWIAIVVAVVAFPAVAVAQDGMAAWCGGSYGAQGTNFGGCVSADQNVQLAGQGSGLRQGVSVETRPENPAPLTDHSRDIESPGGNN